MLESSSENKTLMSAESVEKTNKTNKKKKYAFYSINLTSGVVKETMLKEEQSLEVYKFGMKIIMGTSYHCLFEDFCIKSIPVIQHKIKYEVSSIKPVDLIVFTLYFCGSYDPYCKKKEKTINGRFFCEYTFYGEKASYRLDISKKKTIDEINNKIKMKTVTMKQKIFELIEKINEERNQVFEENYGLSFTDDGLPIIGGVAKPLTE